MSLISQYTREEFEAELPIDFGSGVRGGFVDSELLIGHMVDNELCATADSALWGFVKRGPRTIDTSRFNCINCPAHLSGQIVEGVWVTN